MSLNSSPIREQFFSLELKISMVLACEKLAEKDGTYQLTRIPTSVSQRRVGVRDLLLSLSSQNKKRQYWILPSDIILHLSNVMGH